MTNIKVFIPAYNEEDAIAKVLAEIPNSVSEIIVVDNNSSDDSCLMMKQLFPQITLIENKVNFQTFN